MKTVGISFSSGETQYKRLHKEDIVRMPIVTGKSVDYFLRTKQDTVIHAKKPSFWRNFFTAATFGLTGLYIAHRNNLFNPIKREVRKIIRAEEFQNKIKDYVYGKINDNMFENATMRLLLKMSKEGSGLSPENAQAATRIYSDTNQFNALFKSVKEKLNDDSNEISRKNGFVVEAINQFVAYCENVLKSRKTCGYNLKDQAKILTDNAFKVNKENNLSKIDEFLHDAIAVRIYGTVENFVKSVAIDAKYAKV